ncbi:MAG: sulfite exporter TauE/SafE family protein [Rhodospirillales bacterium]|jgi:uncharacterized membrane protein YfcA|nr:sulfite exporter TauE/SafE family protein [Rhodospirillales bacterium]
MVDNLSSVLSGIGPSTLVIVAVMAFIAGVVGGLSGMGGALVLSPFIAPLIGVKAVVPVLSVAMLFGQGGRVWVYRDSLSPRIAAGFLLGIIPGTMIGATLYAAIPPDAVNLLLGMFLIAIVPWRRRAQRRQAFQLQGAGLVLASVGIGILAGSTIGVGILLFPLVMASGLVGAALIATKALISISIHVTKVALFSSYDLLPPHLIAIGICIGAFTVPGAFAARFLFRHIPTYIHTTTIDILVFLGGLSFLWNGLRSLIG